MKKLIINEKNLPRPGKQTDSSIRIRINKSTLPPHETVPIRKSHTSQLHDVDLCLQTFQKSNNRAILVDEDKISLIVQVLKCYRESLTMNNEFTTHSVRSSKIKFKTISQIDGKENYTVPLKTEGNKQLTESERLQQILEKPLNGSKSPKNRRYFSMCRRAASDEKDGQEQGKNQFPIQSYGKQQEECIAQTSSLKLEQEKPHCSTTQQFQPSESQSEKILKLSSEMTLLRNQLQEKNSQISDLNDRIQQLNINIENLIKKNSLKAEEYNKLYEEYNQVKQYYSQIYSLEKQLANLHNDYASLQEENKELIRKKEELQFRFKKLEEETTLSTQKHQSEKQSYQLTRKDLGEENQRLLQLLSNREQELTHLYRVTSNPTIDPIPSKESQICAI